MKKTLLSTVISAVALTTASGVQAQSLDQFVKDSSVDLNFRYRVESSDVDNTKEAALANTLKSRVTLKTGEIAGLSVLVEGDNVLHVTDDFNDDPKNTTAEHNLVLDQETTQLNQAYVQYSGNDTLVRLGNQRINLDNQRHVGGVAFRQDEATFDALVVQNKSVENTTITLGLSNNLNTITNDNSEEDYVIANVKYQVNPDLAAVGFLYQADDDTTVAQTMGVRAVGKVADISYEAELARQSNDQTDHTPLYLHLSASKKLGSVNTKVGYELLGSDEDEGANVAFATPLGTNHKFLGWSDVYLKGAGGNGIQDLYLNAVTNVAGVKIVGQLHKFDAAEGSADLGSEIGLLVAKKIQNYGVSLKLAQFLATDDSEAMSKKDTTKVWLTGTAKF